LDRGVLQVQLIGAPLGEVRDISAIAHCMDGTRQTGLVERIDTAAGRLALRDPETHAPQHIALDALRCLIMQGFVPTDERARLLASATRGRIEPSDSITLTYRDGQRLSFGPHHRAVDADGLHIYQFADAGRVSRLFIPARVLGAQQAASADALAREDLIQAGQQIITSPRELAECLDHGGAALAVAASHRPVPTRQKLAELLVREHIVSEQQIHEVLELRAGNPRKRTGDILLEMGAVSVDELYACLGRLFCVPYVKLHDFEIADEAIGLLRQGVARRANAVPIMAWREYLVVAMNNPADAEALDLLRFVTDRPVLPVLATQFDIDWAIGKRFPHVDHSDAIEQATASSSGEPAMMPSGGAVEPDADDEPMVKLVNNLIAEAVQRRVSDIHLRPAEDHVDLIYRIDGTLVPVVAFPKAIHAALIGRIKIMGGMDISEKRLPQDGQIRFRAEEAQVDLRVSIMPTVVGESVVIRVLNTKVGMKPVEQLGFSERDLAAVKEMLDKSYGLILVTGPTGSGKSTTLYSCLKHLMLSNVNIITVEDPVEYRIEGIEQVQVRSDIGYGFAKALRQILRHDPDAILIGEIRDQETAEIAIKSALTGHVVLSTLHTNNAVGAITRLRDMGVLSYLLSSTVLGAQAQRLIRTNCLACMEEERVDANVRRVMGVDLHELFMKGRGCEECNHTGYKGRTVVYELLRMTPKMQEKVTAGATAEALFAQAVEDGMVPLTQHALELARSYKTSLSEAYRVRLE
jgi:type IV pilus assembly protein PilB